MTKFNNIKSQDAIQEGISDFIAEQEIPIGLEFQERHYGIDIAPNLQPRCPRCGGGMALNIGYPNDKCLAFWWCLGDCSDTISFDDWYDELPEGKVKSHFAYVGIPLSALTAYDFKDRGYKRVGGHNWGGGSWGILEGKKAWTGHGGCLEYWQKPGP
jgi:hypothetical protein